MVVVVAFSGTDFAAAKARFVPIAEREEQWKFYLGA